MAEHSGSGGGYNQFLISCSGSGGGYNQFLISCYGAWIVRQDVCVCVCEREREREREREKLGSLEVCAEGVTIVYDYKR